AVPRRGRAGNVDDAAAAGAHCDDDRALPAVREEHVLRPGRAVEEVPRAQGSLRPLDDQRALALQHEERLLPALPVVQPEPLARLEHVHVEPELREAPLPLERAVRAERPLLLPPRLGALTTNHPSPSTTRP